MKRSVTVISALLILVLLITNCRKKEKTEEPAPAATTTGSASVTENGQSLIDNEKIIFEADASASDINTTITNYSALNGKFNQASSITTVCGMTVDTNGMHLGTIRLDYNGTVCAGRKRTGSIQLTIQNFSTGIKWKNMGAVVKVDYLNYKMINTTTSQTVALNGTAYLTNQSGGTFLDLFLATQTNLAHTYTANSLLVQLNALNTYTYNVNREVTYTYSSSVFTASVTSNVAFGGYSNLESWGSTGSDSVFCSITNPIVWNTTCGAWSPVTGNVTVKVKSKSYNLNGTLGVDAAGTPVVPTPSTCPYGYKINWTIGSTTSSVVVGYF